jgi:hypothetical protein
MASPSNTFTGLLYKPGITDSKLMSSSSLKLENPSTAFKSTLHNTSSGADPITSASSINGDVPNIAAGKIGKGAGKEANLSGGIGLAAGLMTAASGLVKNEDASTYMKNVGTYAGMGLTAGGPVGAAVGAGFGIVKSAIENKNRKEDNRITNILKKREAADKRSLMQQESDTIRFSNLSKMAANGLRFDVTYKLNLDNEIKMYKRGGHLDALKKNIIPAGFLHEEKNDLHPNDKGLPVVHCKKNVCEKTYEIEAEELIIHADAISEIESLKKEYNAKKDPKILEQLGAKLQKEILENTYDYTKKLL